MKEEKDVKQTSAIAIKTVAFQTPFTHPGLGGVSNLSTTKQKGLDMTYAPIGLIVKWKGETIIVPTSNIKLMIVDETKKA